MHPLPKVSTGILCYKRQNHFYDLAIHDASSKQGIFNVRTENIASRGSQEVRSCLKTYIEEYINAPVKELRL